MYVHMYEYISKRTVDVRIFFKFLTKMSSVVSCDFFLSRIKALNLKMSTKKHEVSNVRKKVRFPCGNIVSL